MSTKTGMAPNKAMDSAVEIKVKGLVMTSSPGFIPIAIIANSNASVPLEQAMACFAPVKAERFSSSSKTGVPMIKDALERTD